MMQRLDNDIASVTKPASNELKKTHIYTLTHLNMAAGDDAAVEVTSRCSTMNNCQYFE